MKKNFCAPNTDPEFIKYWDLFLPQIVDRSNFHESHLQQLALLCGLYVDYHELTVFIKENGYSYMTSGRYGDTSRAYAEVGVRQKIASEIRAYSKMLGLLIDKADAGKPDDPEDNEWEMDL